MAENRIQPATMQDPIRDPKTLSDSLGSGFVLLAGSAVSGSSNPRLPMVQPFMKNILCRAASILETGSYGERLIARYAKSLIKKRGSHSKLLESTKFEEFLWQIQTAAGRDQLNELLASVYACQGDEYGLNQSAISWLLEKGVCLACLTTNFDNSIELALPRIRPIIHPNYPKSLEDQIGSPMLLKLHGDAKERNCISTSRAMSEARHLGSHQVLRKLLAKKTVLVLGYSGTGDVDIRPHLNAEGTTYLWGVRKSEGLIPPFSRRRVLCDLDATDSERNLLLGLARLHGWQGQHVGQSHEWSESLDAWCERLSHESLARIVMLTFFRQTGWPVVRAHRFTPVQLECDHKIIDEGIVFLQISTYGPAEKAFRTALSSSLTRLQSITAKLYLGFTQWRQGNLRQALETLSWFLDDTCWPDSEGELKEKFGDGLRVFLEVARDQMQLMRSTSERRAFYRTNRLKEAIERLERLDPIDLKGDTLARTVIMNISQLIGESIDEERLQELFDDSYAAMIWQTAEAVGRLLVHVSFRKGLAALIKIDLKLKQLRKWNTIRKSGAAMLYSLLGSRFPIILNVIDGPLSAKTTWWRYWRYRIRAVWWEAKAGVGITWMLP